MKRNLSVHSLLIIFHAILGVLVFVLPFTSKLYTLVTFIFGLYFIIKTQNSNNEVLIMCAYIVSMEVLLRMTNGMLLNEFGKYSILVYLLLGMIYTGFSNKGFIYWIFLLLLIPGIILSSIALNLDTDIRKAMAFNISGPVCLGISSIYCCQRKISFDRLKDVISSFSFPLISMVVYLFLYTPSVRDVITGTQSNFETSGGFGPNQVSTLLGLGVFVFFVQMLFNSKSLLMQIVNIGLVLIFAFRGIVTFSRGGMITAVVMIFFLLIVIYFQANSNIKQKIGIIVLMSFLAGIGVWTYSSIQTHGFINKRYANEDAIGRKKESQLSGREVLMETELEMFLNNPVFGVGVGKNKELRKEKTGIDLVTHNEITRLLAEHGSFGIAAFLILLFTPIVFFINNRQNIFALSFLIFWLLTINHAAMRTAAPAFVYALSLLFVQVKIPEETEN